MINILIVDDHQVLADGIKALLSQEDDFKIVHHCIDGRSTMDYLQEQELPKLILLDINLPDTNGIQLCKDILEKYPSMKILALTMHHEPEMISQMVKAGVHGYLLKNTSQEELVSAIHKVYEGENYFSKTVTDRLLQGMQKQNKHTSSIQKITRREKEILKLIIEEMTTEEIAEKLFISPTTVISHRKSLLRKLNAKNTAGLVKAAYEFRLMD